MYFAISLVALFCKPERKSCFKKYLKILFLQYLANNQIPNNNSDTKEFSSKAVTNKTWTYSYRHTYWLLVTSPVSMTSACLELPDNCGLGG